MGELLIGSEGRLDGVAAVVERAVDGDPESTDPGVHLLFPGVEPALPLIRGRYRSVGDRVAPARIRVVHGLDGSASQEARACVAASGPGYSPLMRIGSSIGLIAVGLILALAVNVNLGGIDLNLIGWILAVVGVIGLVTSLAMARQARPVVVREEPLPPTTRDHRY